MSSILCIFLSLSVIAAFDVTGNDLHDRHAALLLLLLQRTEMNGRRRRPCVRAITYLFASSPQHPPLNCMLEEYRLRFEIESSYRLMSKSRIRTSTKDPKLRAMYMATSLLLVNTWVGEKWDCLSTKRRGPGGRDVHAGLLPYPRFLAMLQYVIERESMDSYWPSMPRRRREQLAHRGGDLRTTECRTRARPWPGVSSPTRACQATDDRFWRHDLIRA